MMKLLILVLISSIPYSFLTSLTTLLVILYFLSFYLSHSLDIFNFYQYFFWDTLSFSLNILTLLITILMLLASLMNKNILKFNFLFISTTTILLTLLILAFSVSNLILFYILFESSLIPIFLIILGWGNQPERLQAGMYMLIYTVLSSLPLLLSILLWSNLKSSTSMLIITSSITNDLVSYLMSFTLIMAFSVKLPIYFLHIWLPKAHVEAPVAGSMVLAAILLKLGGYGILRIAMKFHSIYYLISPLIISWALSGGVMATILCLFQTDIKLLIALSSIAHMSLVVSSALTFSSWGINSAQFIMIGHGFCSSALFYIANTVYERINSRSLFIFKGLQTIMPSFSMMWFLMCTSNMAAPPSLNLLGEMQSISSLYCWSPILFIFLMLLVFMAAVYSLFLFNQTQHGKISSLVKPCLLPSLRDWLVMMAHWLPLNMLFLTPWLMQIYI